MMRWKTIALATATFGLLTGVALADDQPQPEATPPVQQKAQDQDQQNPQNQNPVTPDQQNQGDVKPDEGQKGKLPSDLDSDTGKGQGMGTTPDVKKDDTKGNVQGEDKGDVKGGDVKGGDIKGGDVKGGDVKSDNKGDVGAGADTGAATGMKAGAQHVSKQQIQDVQQKLKDQGFYAGDIDGLIGPKTKAGIKQFQQSKNLPVNGHLDPATLNAFGMGGGSQPNP
jgi:hypothetical protein